jgi:hypothetical protein
MNPPYLHWDGTSFIVDTVQILYIPKGYLGEKASGLSCCLDHFPIPYSETSTLRPAGSHTVMIQPKKD